MWSVAVIYHVSWLHFSKCHPSLKRTSDEASSSSSSGIVLTLLPLT
jgi:hypothetical protein